MAEAVIQQIFPGPCPPEGCPPPTEIVCIAVPKVYDFCFQQETGLTNCVSFTGTIPTSATCTITSVTCTAGTPVPTGIDGFSTVSIVVAVQYTITYDTTVSPTQTFIFTKTVTMCAPTGTTADCTMTSVTCGPCTVVPTGTLTFNICCGFNICLIVETTADVKLLVPAYGFCTPAPCRTGGFPPCPPFPLFPPQCELV